MSLTWKDVGQKILDVAPYASALAAPFLGPAGPALIAATGSLKGIFGVKSDNPQPEELLSAIQADPQAAFKIQTLAMQYAHDERMALLQKDVEEIKLGYGDVQNARGRQVEHEKVTRRTDINLYLLAWLFVGGFFATFIIMLVLIFTGKFPSDISPAAVYLMGTMNGTLTAAVGAVVQFFFGKTKDSASHTQMLADSIPLTSARKLMGLPEADCPNPPPEKK